MSSQKSSKSKKAMVPTEKLFKCDICGQSFFRGCGLASHLRKHTAGVENELLSRPEAESKENGLKGDELLSTSQVEPAGQVRKSGRIRRKVTWSEAGYDDHKDEDSMIVRAPPKKTLKISERAFRTTKMPQCSSASTKMPTSKPKYVPIKANTEVPKISTEPETSQEPEEPRKPYQPPNNVVETPLIARRDSSAPPRHSDFVFCFRNGQIHQRHSDEVKELYDKAVEEYNTNRREKLVHNYREPEEAGHRPLKYLIKELAIEESRKCPDCSYKNDDIDQFRRHRDNHYAGYYNKCKECSYTATHPKLIRKHMFYDHFLQDVKYVEGISSSESEEEELVIEVIQEKPKKRKRRRRADKW
uniref:C2H2-type domain-containing protein n=1 Tax=Caenorhabditis tropicalis TaxID=1561998 RepID=A0A1I7V1Q1_9PELO